MKRSITKDKLLKIFAIIFWICIWQIVCFFVQNNLLLPSPIEVIRRLGALIMYTKFWGTIANSFLRILTGFFIGASVGVIAAIASWKLPILKIILHPAMVIVKSTPLASFIILALVWIKTSRLSIFISFLMVFPILYGNVLQGIESVSKELLEMAYVYKLSRWKKFKFIYIPAILPAFLSAITTGIGFAWKSGIAAEVLASPHMTIGKAIYESKIYLEITDLFAWTLTVILLSMILERVFVSLTQKLQKWMQSIKNLER